MYSKPWLYKKQPTPKRSEVHGALCRGLRQNCVAAQIHVTGFFHCGRSKHTEP